MFSSEQLTTERCEVVKDEVGSVPIDGSETHVMVTAFEFDSHMKQVTPNTRSARVPISSKVFRGEHDPSKQWCFVIDRFGKPTLRAVKRNEARKERSRPASEPPIDLTEEVDATEDLAEIQQKIDALSAQVAQLTNLLTRVLNVE